MTPLQSLRERRHAELERQYRDFEERHRRDIQERQKQETMENFLGRSQNEGSMTNMYMIWLGYFPMTLSANENCSSTDYIRW